MKSEKRHKIKTDAPEPTLRRLPVYLHYLQKQWEKGEVNISAPTIGTDLNYDSTQVVKDISYTGTVGKPRIGYNTWELIRSIEEYLGFNKKNEAILIGVGNLGSAIMNYSALEGIGIKIIAAFDVDPLKVGTQVGSISVMHTRRMEELTRRLGVKIAILTTPVSLAQQYANSLIDCGVKAIWNFTPGYLNVPENVVVQNTSMYSNVAVLLKKLEAMETIITHK